MRGAGARRAGLAAVVLTSLAVAAFAAAQTRARPGRPRRPSPVADAAPAPSVEVVAPAPDAGAPPAEEPRDAAAAAVEASAPPVIPWGDGGARPSPLTPAPAELAAPVPSAAPPADLDRVLGEIAALRARVAVMSDVLFQSRLAIVARVEGAHARVGRFVVLLDDGAVYTAPPGFRADEGVTVYDHAVAPGKHAVTIDVDRRDDRDEGVRTAQRTRFVVDVPRDQRLELEVRVTDESQTGEYDLRVRARAAARPVKR